MSSYLLTEASGRVVIQQRGGNKGRFLFELSALGLPVPPWVILSADAFRDHCRRQGLEEVIRGQLARLERQRAGEISTAIVQAILASDLAEDLRDEVTAAVHALGDVLLAVRSSGVEEDGASLSFAGQFDSILGVRGVAAACEAVKRCWASAYSERALVYRCKHGVPADGVALGVIFQELVEPEVSGVTFTVNPTTGNPFEVLVSAVYGLGEGLVSGAVDADVLTLDKHTGAVKNRVLGGKHERHGVGGVRAVAEEDRARCCLRDDQLDALRRLSLQVESALGRPQDIEWCVRDDRLWLLQARPVTALRLPITASFDVWDNSNIIENYPGITAPLTFTFARHLYGKVFLEYCKLLKIPDHHLREMESYLGSLLGQVRGRVYYNLLHWYKLVGVNPLQTLGRKMMEVQMGVSEPLDLEAAVERIKPYHPRSRFELLALRAVSSGRFVEMLVRSERYVRAFERDFGALFERYGAIRYDDLPPETVFAHYKAFERGILAIWGPTVSLESAIGLPYGLLRSLLARWLPDAPPWLETAVIGGVEDVESIEPARRMEALAALVRRTPGAEPLLRTTDAAALLRALRSEYPTLSSHIDAYIRDFGYRAHNELKLEEPDMHEDPGVLFEMLRAVLATGALSPHRGNAEHGQEQVERILRARLRPEQRLLLRLVRDLVRGAIRRRETVRFCRSRTFGLFRRMFVRLGAGLAQYGVLAEPRDVFFLTREELDGCFEGGTAAADWRAVVEQRKRDARAFAEGPEPSARFVSRGPLAAWLAWSDASDGAHVATASAVAGELRGTPCSPGYVEGKARVVREPTEFDGGVLVTYRTDPGWIAVFPSAQALLVERGSPLTHAAIVARELGLPTIVQIPGLTRHVQDGAWLRVDAEQGRIFTAESADNWRGADVASA